MRSMRTTGWKLSAVTERAHGKTFAPPVGSNIHLKQPPVKFSCTSSAPEILT